MGRTRQKASPTDQHAERIADAIASGNVPSIPPDLDMYLESAPREIFAALEGAARNMPPGRNETLAFGYLFLLLDAVQEVLRQSGELGELEVVAQSWFEDSPEIAQMVSGAGGAKRAKLAAYLLQSVAS